MPSQQTTTNSLSSMYTAFFTYNGVVCSLGVAPFVAGASTATFGAQNMYYSGIVWWNDLNVENACQPNSPIYQQWSLPNNLCRNNGTVFQIPTEAMAIQSCMVLATIFAFLATMFGFAIEHNRFDFGNLATLFSIFAMIFAVSGFALWTTWDMSQDLQNSQTNTVIPIWGSTDGGKTIKIVPSPGSASKCLLLA
jgi:hypothetical protein